MDLKKYEVLLKVIERGSINNVSYDMGYTHSGISKMLNSMETELGFQIIKRNNKGIALTSEGLLLVDRIRRLLAENEKLEEEIAQIKGLETGKIRVGCFPTIAFALMPEIIRSFSEKYPHIEIEVLEENDIERLEQWLNQGIVDIAAFSRHPRHSYEWVREFDDMYVALLPKGHPLTEYDIVPLEKMFEHKIILFKSHKGLDQDIVQILQYKDVGSHAGYTVNSDFTAIRMVDENNCVALMPELIARHGVKMFNVEYRPIDVDLNRNIGFALKNKGELSPSMRKFVKCLKEVEIPKD